MSIAITLGIGIFSLKIAGASLVATDVIRAGDQISESNVEAKDGVVADEDTPLFGREVRRTVYAGQTIRATNTKAPRLVSRNQAVTVRYVSGGLEITMMGRAMADGVAGENISVMNTKSRELVQGTVTENGWILAQ
jgi:flagella basal body P-ring formation protein FlgA